VQNNARHNKTITRLVMKMRIWLLTSLLLIGCANSQNECGNKVLVPWPVAGGACEQSFREIVLRTLINPYRLHGGAAKVFFESGVGAAGLEGSVAEPRYTQSGDVCVPTDAGSSMAVAVYAQFERIMGFERKLGVLDMLSWPRNVGVEIHLRMNGRDTHSNAHYVSAGDAVLIQPFKIDDSAFKIKF
jgi:hypothetical protein